MSKLYRTTASLRFFGDTLDPDEISGILGAPPTKALKNGDTWTTGNGTQIIARTGSWLLYATDEVPGNLDRQISALFQSLTTDFDAWRELSARFRGNIFVGLFLSEFNQ